MIPLRVEARSTFSLPGPLSVGDLLDRAFRLYRARISLFVLTAAIFCVPLAFISILFTREAIAVDFLVALLVIPATGAASLAVTVLSVEALHGRSLTAVQGIRRGVRRFWSFIGMMIVQLAAIFVITTVVMAPIFLVVYTLLAGSAGMLGAGETASTISDEGLGWLILGVFLFFFILAMCPIVYLSARWLAAPAALVAEGTGPIQALRRSWHLSRRNVRRMIGYVILLYTLLITLLITPAATLQWIIVIALPSNTSELFTGLTTALFSLFSTIATPFYIGAVVLLYYDLRIRNESYDLELRVADLEQQMAQNADPEGATPGPIAEEVG